MNKVFQRKRFNYTVLSVLGIGFCPYIAGLGVVEFFPVIRGNVDLTQLHYLVHYFVGLLSLMTIVSVLGILYGFWIGGRALYNYIYCKDDRLD